MLALYLPDRRRPDGMKVLVDGVVFGMSQSIVADAWEQLLRGLSQDPDLQIEMLDRGGAPAIGGITLIGFPSYRDEYTPADSQLLQRVATHHGAEVFVSTGWTTPTTTPSVAMVFAGALPPETVLSARQSGECALAIRHASRVVCVDEQARLAVGRHLALDEEQLRAVVEVPAGEDGPVPYLASALRAAAASAAAGADFYRRWAAIRDIQARVDG